MKTFRVFTFQLLACCYFLTAAAHASDELIVYVFENGSPLSGVDVQLDDQILVVPARMDPCVVIWMVVVML